MAAENLAAVLHGPFDVRIEKRPMPVISDDEVLICVECVGICGSDVKTYTTGKCGLNSIVKPMVLGHEGAGTVIQVGSKVKYLKKGDRVAIEPGQPCRSCEYCKEGRYNLCPHQRYCSYNDTDGNIIRYYKHVADFCHKVPDNLSLAEAAAIQPLAIAIHACNRAGIEMGSKLVILGAGPIGVLCAMTAQVMGASNILITDINQKRLDVAKKNVNYTMLVKNEYSEKNIADSIIKTLGTKPDITIDACGVPSAQRTALMVTKSGGTVLVVGIGDDTVTVPPTQAMLREVDLKGCYRINNTYPSAIDAVSKGFIDLKSFITDHFPLEKTKEALDLAETRNAMKIIIQVQS